MIGPPDLIVSRGKVITVDPAFRLAEAVAVRDGRIQPGQVLLMEAMGGGMTWGAGLARW